MLIDRHLERYNIPLSEMRPEYWVEGVAQRFFGGDGGGGGGGGPDSASRRAQPRLATSRGCGREAEVPSLVPRALGVLSAGRLSARRSSHRATRSPSCSVAAGRAPLAVPTLPLSQRQVSNFLESRLRSIFGAGSHSRPAA